jgi:pimeloyl-ACP methyl ester carboxylesterase
MRTAWHRDEEVRMDPVRSRDGTVIAYTRQGRGPALILVTGGLDDGSENAPLAAASASSFTAFSFNRRGRAASGDTPPYALEREIEDIDALIREAGGSAYLYGVSTGGALVLEGAAAGLAVDALAVYEVPYMTSGPAIQAWREYVGRLEVALAAGDRGQAGELFMRLAGSPEEQISEARNSPYWPGVEALAHTLAYDAACLGDGAPPTDRLATITQPTLVVTGGRDELFESAARAIEASMPHAERLVLQGQGHVVDPVAMASALTQFFGQ